MRQTWKGINELLGGMRKKRKTKNMNFSRFSLKFNTEFQARIHRQLCTDFNINNSAEANNVMARGRNSFAEIQCKQKIVVYAIIKRCQKNHRTAIFEGL